MVAVQIMLAQKIFAVVVAVGCAQYDVNVVFVRLAMLAERDAALVVELDDNHGALDPVVKSAVVFHAAHPAEMSVFQMAFHFGHFDLRMTVAHAPDMIFDEIQQEILLPVRKIVVADAGVVEHQIIAERGGKSPRLRFRGQ